ncbi:hypothetical protein BH10ACI1_BH10ACI1_18830 [soil metagenome]
MVKTQTSRMIFSALYTTYGTFGFFHLLHYFFISTSHLRDVFGFIHFIPLTPIFLTDIHVFFLCLYTASLHFIKFGFYKQLFFINTSKRYLYRKKGLAKNP